MKKMLSIVIPAFNEEGNITKIYEKLIEQFNLLVDYDFEIIFVNDGSTDRTGEKIDVLSDTDPRVKHVEFSRNFNKEVAISAGIQLAHGNGIVIIDADLQHPVELLGEFIKKWEAGAEVVIGLREKNEGVSAIRKLVSYLFYKIMSQIGEVPLLLGETDYRLIDECVAVEFRKFSEHARIARGLINWLGFKRDFVYFTASKRSTGRPGYSTLKLVSLGVSTVITHSVVPLKLAGYLGAGITFFSVMFGLFIIGEVFIIGDPMNIDPSGTALLAIMIMFLIGIVLICMGFMSIYISNIREEVANRPMFVIRKTRNL